MIRSPRESFFSSVELLLSSIIFGFIANYIHNFQDNKQLHDQSFFNYWLIIDSTVSMLTLGYIYLIKWLHVESTIIRNFFTLKNRQRKKLKELREQRKKEKQKLSPSLKKQIVNNKEEFHIMHLKSGFE